MRPCPTCDERLMEYVCGEIDPALKAAFEAHLGASSACAREAESLRATLAAGQRRLEEEPSPALLAGLKAEARKQAAEVRASSRASERALLRERGASSVRPARGWLARVADAVTRSVRIPVWVPALSMVVVVAGAFVVFRQQQRAERALGVAPPALQVAAGEASQARANDEVGTTAGREDKDIAPGKLAESKPAATTFPAARAPVALPAPAAAPQAEADVAAARNANEGVREKAKRDEPRTLAKDERVAVLQPARKQAKEPAPAVETEASAAVPGEARAGDRLEAQGYVEDAPGAGPAGASEPVTYGALGGAKAGAPAAAPPEAVKPQPVTPAGAGAGSVLAALRAGDAARVAAAYDAWRPAGTGSRLRQSAAEERAAARPSAASTPPPGDADASDLSALLAGAEAASRAPQAATRLAALALLERLGSEAEPTGSRALARAVELAIEIDDLARARAALARLESRQAPQASAARAALEQAARARAAKSGR